MAYNPTPTPFSYPMRPATELECKLYDELLACVPEFMAQHAIKDIEHGGKPLQDLAMRVNNVIKHIGFEQRSDALYVVDEPDILDDVKHDLTTIMNSMIDLQQVSRVMMRAGWNPSPPKETPGN